MNQFFSFQLEWRINVFWNRDLRQLFWRKILGTEFRGVFLAVCVSESRFEDFVYALKKCFWGNIFFAIQEDCHVCKSGFCRMCFLFLLQQFKDSCSTMLKSSFFWFRFCISYFDCISVLEISKEEAMFLCNLCLNSDSHKDFNFHFLGQQSWL